MWIIHLFIDICEYFSSDWGLHSASASSVKVSLYWGTFPYITLLLGWQISFIIPRTSLYQTIIGRGWAKYRDLSVASGSIIRRCRRQRQIIDNWSCFIIQQDNVFMHLTSTLVSQLFIPTPGVRFHSVQNFDILHKKYKISKFRFR